MEPLGLVAVGLVILVGLVGIVVPVLPGLLLIWSAIAVWAFVEWGSASVAAVLAIATLAVVVGMLVKYYVGDRRMRAAGIPRGIIAVGAVVGIVGFFVVPVIGLPLGFVAGILGAELVRTRELGQAWRATVQALKAVGLAVLIELAAGLLATTAWIVGVVSG